MDDSLLHHYEVWKEATLTYLEAEVNWDNEREWAQEEDDIYFDVLEEKFEEAKARVSEIEEELGDDVVLLFNKKLSGEE